MIQNLHVLMAILYRPIVKSNHDKYEIEKYSSSTVFDRADIFKEKMTVDIVLSALAFQTAQLQAFIEHIGDSLNPSTVVVQTKQKSMKKRNQEILIQDSMKNGDGNGLYIQLQEMIKRIKKIGWKKQQ